MTFPGVARMVLALGASLLLAGCDAFFGGGADDSKNALLAEARVRRDQYDYPGAVGLLEKALEANPRLARAHWDLGLICYQNTKEYATAIYHLQRLLKLEPAWKQAEDAHRIIEDCKLELAKTAPFGPETPEGQRLLSSLTLRLQSLTDEVAKYRSNTTTLSTINLQLQNDNARLREALQRTQPPASPAPAMPVPAPAPTSTMAPPGRPLVTNSPATVNPGRSSSPAPSNAPAGTPRGSAPPPSATSLASVRPPPNSPRTYVIRSGDTLTAIARRYSVPVEELRRLNPGLDARRLKPGQPLRLP